MSDSLNLKSSLFSAQLSYINETRPADEAVAEARVAADEYGVPTPDALTGDLLTTLAAAGSGANSSGAVAVTPAIGVAGLYILRGLGEKETLTCIDPEAEHQNQAKATFRAAGYSPSRARLLAARPLDVMGRLANDSYHLVYLDVSPLDMSAAIDAALPLLTVGGTVVLAHSLLDGTIADETRRDRETEAARGADEKLRELDNVVCTRLPLGGGLTLVTRRH